jgi:hypothetical protein
MKVAPPAEHLAKIAVAQKAFDLNPNRKTATALSDLKNTVFLATPAQIEERRLRQLECNKRNAARFSEMMKDVRIFQMVDRGIITEAQAAKMLS